MRSERVCGRFAPSPSGRLHLGNLMSSLLAWLDVRSQNGVMLFRLEDLDPERSWEHYADQMADDLRWLGLDWDVGWEPGSQDYRQGTRGDYYAEKLQQLRDMLLQPLRASGSLGAPPRRTARPRLRLPGSDGSAERRKTRHGPQGIFKTPRAGADIFLDGRALRRTGGYPLPRQR